MVIKKAAKRGAGGAPLTDICRYLDRYLRIASIPDGDGIINGLQVANEGRVRLVVAAVDACQATIDAAAVTGQALLLVHHGLMVGALSGRLGRRLRALHRGDSALYAAHIPLDLHPKVGNNVLLGRWLGLRHMRPFGTYHDLHIGVAGRLARPLDGLVADIAAILGTVPRVVATGPVRTSRVAVITGAGSRWIDEAAALGVDTLVTGEGTHHSYFDAEERGINVIYAGHYATETVGVKALARHVSERFDLPWAFVDHPTGL